MVRVAPAFTPDFAPITPLHGYRGEAAAATARPPRGLTVAITREAGARGGRIARRVGQLLGWQVFDQEMLGYLVQSETARVEMMADIPPDSLAWANLEHARQLDARHLGGGDQTELLPAATTVNVRIIAPLDQRVAYFSQWLRLTPSEAEIEVAARDRVRSALQIALVGSDPDDPTQYDLLLNSGRLGEAECAELIARAVRVKQLLPDAADPFLPQSGDGESEPV